MGMEIKPMSEPLKSKKPYLSKTIILNAALAVAAFFPAALAWMQANMEIVVSGIGVINIILRAVTKDKISIGE